MTFPVVATVNYSEESVDTTTHDVLVPASISAGDLLLLFVSIDAPQAAPTISGWTNILYDNGAHGVGVWYKFAAGGETAFTYTTSGSQQSANRTWRVTGAHASQAPEIGPGQDGFRNTWGCDILTPSWGVDDTLWVAYVGFDGGAGVSAYPTSFTDNQFTDTSTGGSAETRSGLALCSYNLNASSHDPVGGTLTASVNVIGMTLGVRPSVGTPGASTGFDPMGMSGFFGG
jgi:hypothetical protein